MESPRRNQRFITQGNELELITQANIHNLLCRIGDSKTLRKRGDMADACAHSDVECASTLTESGIILWHHRLV